MLTNVMKRSGFSLGFPGRQLEEYSAPSSLRYLSGFLRKLLSSLCLLALRIYTHLQESSWMGHKFESRSLQMSRIRLQHGPRTRTKILSRSSLVSHLKELFLTYLGLMAAQLRTGRFWSDQISLMSQCLKIRMR